MCTLVLAHRHFASAPLVVAANRDEFLARPAAGPSVIQEGLPRAMPRGEGSGARLRVLMPRDLTAGGSWLGLNARGLFVGITNRVGPIRDPSRRSRGLLVVEALALPDARSLHRYLAGVRPAELNPFHLLYADPDDAFVTWSDGEALSQYRLEPGVHIVTERSLGADDRGRIERLTRAAEPILGKMPGAAAPSLAQLRELLALHGPAEEPFAGSCIHAESRGYGTRSSFAYIANERPVAAWSEGHPCESGWVDISPLLAELFGVGGD